VPEVKPAPFELHRPTTVDQAVGLLTTHGDEAKPLAGGQSLVPVMALRLARFEHLVDLTTVPDLRGVRRDGDHLVIGATTTQADVLADPLVAAHAPLVARATAHIGHFQIRNRGTIGGSLAHADGAAEYPATVLALDAGLEATGPAGTRRIPAGAFFLGPFTTALEPDEILTAVRVPVADDRSGFAVEELARRRGDFALAGAVVAVHLDGSGAVDRAALALFGIGSVPVRAAAAEAALLGTPAGAVDPGAVGALAASELDPVGDVHASADYRRSVAGVVVTRALARALEEASHAR
jgi:carbon-monoxide dehydrogenase medium subunit